MDVKGTRKAMDCRKFPSQMNCSLRISGTEDEVLAVAVQHAVAVHGEKDGPELRRMIKQGLEDDVEARPSRPSAQTPARA
jgi:hypothetical protein